MVVCQYYLRGQCRFGQQCRNEHPAGAKPGGGFGSQTWSAGPNAGGPAAANVPVTSASLFTVETLRKDITPGMEKPQWPLSSFGPAKYQPTLVTGLDESPEELRVRAVTALKSGNTQDYVNYETSRISAADQTYSGALTNINQLHEQAVRNFNNAQNPLGAATTSAFGAGGTTSAFGAGAAGAATSAFGAPANPSALGKPTGFGAFAGGGPSAFGGGASASTTTAFGKPAFGQSAFGQPASSTTTSAFGQPAFGQPAPPSQPLSAFGQPAQAAATSAFAQPSQAGATSAFGAPAQGATTSAFGQPSQPSSAFGQSSFGQSSLIKPASGAFGSGVGAGGGGAFSAFAGSPSAFGLGAAGNVASSTTATPSAFGQSAFGSGGTNNNATPSALAPAQNQPSAFGGGATTSAFGGGASQPAQSAFGGPSTGGSAFGGGAATAPKSVFGQPAFGQPAQPQTQPQAQSAFGSAAPALTSVFGQPSQPVSAFGSAPATAQSAFGGGGGSAFGGNTLANSAGLPPKPTWATPEAASTSTSTSTKLDFTTRRATYKPGLDKYDALLPENYLELLPKNVRDAFEAPKFEWGNIPEWIPPKELR